VEVVLFCGGHRMRGGVSDLPKPMRPVGLRPQLDADDLLELGTPDRDPLHALAAMQGSVVER
jgi:hypothetical protein